jgi:Flp pilus assembly protein TadD
LFLQPYWPGDPAAGLYRPLTISSLAINRGLSGPGPLGFHLVNVILHALACALCWFVLRRVGLHYGTALFGASLFAIHPIHTEAVANIAGRGELLAALGVLAAWIAHHRSVEAETTAVARRWAAVAAVGYLAALLSKEQAVLAPLVFWVDDLFRRKRGAVLVQYAGYALAFGLAVALRVVALGGLRGAQTEVFLDNPAAHLGSWTRVGTALWVQVRYAWLAVWPVRLSSDYSFDAIPPVTSMAEPRLWAGLLWLAVLAAGFWFGLRRSRPFAVAVVCWAAFFVPGSNLLFPAGTAMGERLAYLPSIGVCLLVGHLLAALYARHSSGRVTAIAVLALLLMLGGARTVLRNPDWKDNSSLALHDVGVVPRSAKLQFGAGLAHYDRGDLEAAEGAFLEAVAIYPEYAQAQYDLAQLLIARGATREAIEHLAASAAATTVNPRPFKQLAPLLELAGRRAEALDAYARGCALDPADGPFCFNFGRALLTAGRTEEAQQVLERLVREQPDRLAGVLARGFLHESRGEVEQAAVVYRLLLQRPDLPESIRDNVTTRLVAISP